MSKNLTTQLAFTELELSKPVLRALDDVGYETPTPIQAQTIPHILAGKDVLGQAQTGTGKTAAFALPLLSHINIKKVKPQVLVLAPTRELAIQVAEAFQRYAAHMKGFHVIPIYGGQDIGGQFRRLKRGVHVVVGTPGRVIDHIRRGTLKLDSISCAVLDEADEMLRMGFIDDVKWILDQTPPGRQIALFSATLPSAIKEIAKKYLEEPQEIRIKVRTTTAETINQRYWMVSGLHKLDALTRILEAVTFDAVLIFVRTRIATKQLSDKLEARGYAAAPLSGDIPQKQRETTVGRLKSGRLNILVATDVAARGLDIDRISHVINYDVPYDTESYVHRIGRTGRAGKTGEAILFISPRELRLLRSIERATRQKIEMMQLPSTEEINDKRIADFKQRITDTLAAEDLGFYHQMLEQYRQEHNVPALEIAAALARLVQKDTPLLIKKAPKPKPVDSESKPDRDRSTKRPQGSSLKRAALRDEEQMESFRIEVGSAHGAKPGNIVGAIANEAGIDGEFIGRIKIYEDFSTVDLPEGMPRDVFRGLKKVWVAGQQLKITRLEESPKTTGKKKIFSKVKTKRSDSPSKKHRK
ncbi:DEAD/DEAH box helicase [candidate division KSB1 bacterium]|nr:DEAD/DEAH box helicase [candidate division KSB1 bacterium]